MLKKIPLKILLKDFKFLLSGDSCYTRFYKRSDTQNFISFQNAGFSLKLFLNFPFIVKNTTFLTYYYLQHR